MRVGPYRFFFWSKEEAEPPHVHVESGDVYAKFWLAPIGPARNDGYHARQLGRIRALIEQHREEFLERWHDHFHGG